MSAPKCLIAFGSNFGRTQGIATALGQQLGIEVIALNDITNEILKSLSILIVICASFGNGSIPKSATNFYQAISSPALDLSKLKVVFLSVGSSKYEHFCGGGKMLYEELKNRHAVFPYPYAQADMYNVDELRSAISHFADQIAETAGIENKAKGVDVVLTKVDKKAQELPPNGFMYAKLVSRELLSAPGYEPHFLKYTIDLGEPIYAPGDHFMVLPRNEKAADATLKRLKIAPDTVYQVYDAFQLIPSLQTAQNIFTQYLDCSNPADSLDQITSKPVRPKTFSIASAAGPAEFMIANTGGPATTYLENAEIGSMVAVRHVKGIYEPTDKPMILIALGSGLAPIRSIFMDRKAQNEQGKNLKTLTYYGTRFHAAAEKLWPELEENHVKIAVSREGKKEHVQDLMKEDAELVWEFWKEEGAQCYICGPPTGIAEAIEKLLDTIAQQHGVTDLKAFNNDRKVVIEIF